MNVLYSLSHIAMLWSVGIVCLDLLMIARWTRPFYRFLPPDGLKEDKKTNGIKESPLAFLIPSFINSKPGMYSATYAILFDIKKKTYIYSY